MNKKPHHVTINNSALGSGFTVIASICVIALACSTFVMASAVQGSATAITQSHEVEIGDYIFGTADKAGEASQAWGVGKVTAFTPEGHALINTPYQRFEKLNDEEMRSLYQLLKKFDNTHGVFLWEVFEGLREGRINPRDIDTLASEAIVNAKQFGETDDKNDS